MPSVALFDLLPDFGTRTQRAGQPRAAADPEHKLDAPAPQADIGTLINAGAFIVVVFLVAFFGLRPMAAALTARATPALSGPNFDEVQRSLPTPEAAASADAGAAIGALPGSRSGVTPLDDLRQKIRPAPQERLARMVDLNEERTAQILRKWAAQEVAA